MRATLRETLDEHHCRIAAGIAAIRRHCDAAQPDAAGLGAARLGLSRASAARTRFVREEVLPELRRTADAARLRQIDDMQRIFADGRLVSSAHVTTWSAGAIERDWNGYRIAARRIWALMEEQIERERRLVG